MDKYRILTIQHTGIGGLVFKYGDIVTASQLNNVDKDIESGYVELIPKPPVKQKKSKSGEKQCDKG